MIRSKAPATRVGMIYAFAQSVAVFKISIVHRFLFQTNPTVFSIPLYPLHVALV